MGCRMPELLFRRCQWACRGELYGVGEEMECGCGGGEKGCALGRVLKCWHPGTAQRRQKSLSIDVGEGKLTLWPERLMQQ